MDVAVVDHYWWHNPKQRVNGTAQMLICHLRRQIRISEVSQNLQLGLVLDVIYKRFSFQFTFLILNKSLLFEFKVICSSDLVKARRATVPRSGLTV